MSRAKPWLKMWSEWLGDAKMDTLSLAQQGAWWRLVTLAHECGAAGTLVSGNNIPLSLKEILKTLKITESSEIEAFNQMIGKMLTQGSLHWNSDTLVVTNYQARQERVPSQTKEALAERQRRHREKEHLSRESRDESLPSSPLQPPITNIEEEEEKEKKRDVTPMSRQKSRDIADRVMAEVSKLYQENITEKITGPIADELRDFTENYHGAVEWISLAFGEALSLNKRNWRYIRAILEDWDSKGGPDGRAAQKLRRRAEGKTRQPAGGPGQQRVGAHQRDPLAGAREQGWEVIGGDESETPAPGNEA